MGKGQNVKNHFIKSQKKNIESQKRTSKIRTSKVFLKLIRSSKVTKIEVDQNVESDNNHQLDLFDFWRFDQINETFDVLTFWRSDFRRSDPLSF